MRGCILIYSKNYGKIPDKGFPENPPKKEFASPPPDYSGNLFDVQKPCPQEECVKEAGNCAETAGEPCGCDAPPRDDTGSCHRPPFAPDEPPCGCPPRENPCAPAGIFSKISAEDLLLFGAALFLLFSKESDNIIIPVLLVLVIML